MVRVRFSQALRNTTEERETNIEITNEITVRELINKLTEKYGREIEGRLLEDGELKRFINIGTTLKDTNEVSILPAISGG